jgi:prepilin-type processing-associated H-X9-DG protein
MMGIPAYHDEGSWRTNALAPLGNRLWFCPSNPRRSNGHLLFHFALNRLINGSGRDSRRMRLDSIPAPARTVWLFDNGQRAAVAGPGNLHRTLHRGAANILFLDGGVRRIQPTLAGALATQDQPLWNP